MPRMPGRVHGRQQAPAPEVSTPQQPAANITRTPSAFTVFVSTISNRSVLLVIGAIGLIAAIFLAVRHGRKIRVQRLQLSEEH